MSKRHTMKARRALTAVAITTGLVLTVAGCGGGDDGGDKENTGKESSAPANDKDGDKGKESEEPVEDEVLAEVKGGDNITLTINTAVRDDGGFLTVTGKVKNGSGKFWNPAQWRGDEKELVANAASMAGANVVDKAGKKRYLILRDTDGRCLCTKFTGGFQNDAEKTFYAQFPAPPESATKVDFQVSDMPPATIEISESE
ncbi:hypothetical protein DY218_13220 [Streptomyces triticagri]|uniref:Secreted protein n=1 Tax=Streptomyces triticagri TaxID=2293568 RepID=A0A372M6M5_9ACTN|nr:hypothetical protein [Streptomyces triticagri]RFU86250.1 hypothetical protein DY218_13220 [Streptomyces triticagri]